MTPLGRTSGLLAASASRAARVVLALGLLAAAAGSAAAQLPGTADVPAETLADQERFLASARVVASRPVSTGVTKTLRVTLEDGGRRHDASVQRIDETKAVFRSAPGKQEFGFRDSWKFNLAAYHLAQLLELDAVPATVERQHDGDPASYTWWVDNVIMDEEARQKSKAESPDVRRWEHQMATMRVFDALIANSDRNKGNLLIDKNWTTWLIDHSRAFRRSPEILDPKVLVRCDRRLLAALKALDETVVRARIGRWVTDEEIRALFSRRNEIVARLEASSFALYTYQP